MMIDFSEVWSNLSHDVLQFVTRLPTILLAFLVFVLFVWLAGKLSLMAKRLVNAQGRSQNAGTVIALITRWGLILLGVLVALSIALPSFRASDLIQVLGISSVAIGFAFRDIFQNFLAGLIILLTDAFEIGDQIIVESEDLEGTVTDIHTRATMIQTYDDRKIVIPNATLFTNAVTINTATNRLRSGQVVGISYESDIDAAQALIQDAINSVDGVLSHPAPDVLLDDLADSSVNLRARWWTSAQRSDVLRVKSEVIRRIKNTLDENGIAIPFPTRHLLVTDSTTESFLNSQA
ncbi:MAG: mechanosensitive ion channel family protein [Candidatus Promineifilaceae bacterium]|nr:mechanosensitive ion channel family protein [Candidatus Promineifilaceae bacterium]